ncbi:uncharacterized protein QC761_115700 [Podospora bellae-mahoneyi]|uniref:Uncharacterized protein n=1 Tax=Podospora bellae-mahoneyi TaxID=2093777 RepID=A0ABR0G004_9PEZI|nr:hypothetical protein QC761_115700 [Podospora bellae-mahoneyi]
MWNTVSHILTSILPPVLPIRPRPDSAPTPADGTTAQDSTTGKMDAEGVYKPSITDVIVVKAMLVKGLQIPVEIADNIIELAEYWPHVTAEVTWGDERPNQVWSGESRENQFLLRTPPLGFPDWGTATTSYTKTTHPKPPGEGYPTSSFQKLAKSPVTLLAQPCRRIVFIIRSKDQGWGGEYHNQNTYNGSWTWFEAGLERWCKGQIPDPPQPCESHEDPVQKPVRDDDDNDDDKQPSMNLEDLATVIPEVVVDPQSNEFKFNHPLLPRENVKIQCNKLTKREYITHVVEWNHDDDVDPEDEVAAKKLHDVGRGEQTGNGEFVRNMRIGDVVTVWGKTRFGGWINNISSVKVEVYWSV